MRQCLKCNIAKPDTEYRPDASRRWCKACINAYQRNWRATSPRAKSCIKKGFLKHFYNTTLEVYEAMLAKQGHKCAVCKGEEVRKDHRSGKLHELSVDHCHTTGKIRGLLCMRCNRALGLLKDSPQSVANLLDYLKGAG